MTEKVTLPKTVSLESADPDLQEIVGEDATLDLPEIDVIEGIEIGTEDLAIGIPDPPKDLIMILMNTTENATILLREEEMTTEEETKGEMIDIAEERIATIQDLAPLTAVEAEGISIEMIPKRENKCLVTVTHPVRILAEAKERNVNLTWSKKKVIS